MAFKTEDGIPIPAVTADQMREVDRIAVKEFNLGILQMMENAGRSLAHNALAMLERIDEEVTILAGPGGNGGGGLCCARHLHNRGVRVHVVLDRESDRLTGATLAQFQILSGTGLKPLDPSEADRVTVCSGLVVDALIGYSLRGAPRGRAAELIVLCNQHQAQVLSLDVPSGLDATTGHAPGVVIHPKRTLTLGLPKTGLTSVHSDLYLADIGIPPEVYHRLGISFEPFFGPNDWVRLLRV